MGSVTPYDTSGGRRYRVRYRKPDHSQTDKRGFKTKREAELFLASVEVAKHTGRYIDPSRARVTIGAWMTAWIDSRLDLRASTLDRVQGVIRNHIVPGLRTIAIADLGRLQTQQWASRLSATQSPGSVRKIVNVLSAGMQLAVDDGRIPSNPASRLKLPKQIKSHKKFLTHEQVAELVAAVGAKPSGGGLRPADPRARVHRAAVGRTVRTARARPRLRSRSPRGSVDDDRGERLSRRVDPKEL